MSLISTRFSQLTFEENIHFRSKFNFKCIYGIPNEFLTLPYDYNLFVIEMNNSTNQIEGIGLVKNRPKYDKYYNIYSDKNYNRFIYQGKYYLDRDTLCYYSMKLVYILEYILFKEKNHVKRCMGFTLLTQNYIKKKKDPYINTLNLQIIIKTINACFKKNYNTN